MISAASLANLMSSTMGTGATVTASQMTSDQASGRIGKTAKDFEAMFLSQMMEQMFGDSLGSDAFGDAQTSEVYKSMMMDAYGKAVAKAGGIGIASYIQTELLKLQEVHA